MTIPVKALKTAFLATKSAFLRKKFLSMIASSEGGFMYSRTARDLLHKEYNITIGYGSYGGCFNFGNISGNVSFGNYCSVAKDVKIYRANHPLSEFTLHPILYNPVAGYVDSYKLQKDELSIGHDVWIGDNVIILPGVKAIGNGAVIGAGSVVTRDVEKYAVVAGNPAKVIKKRFPPEMIEKIEHSAWWLSAKEELIAKIPVLRKLTAGIPHHPPFEGG